MDPRAALTVGTTMAYEHLFVSGHAADPRHVLVDSLFPCEWSVRILTGPVPDMGGRFMRHRKRFYLDEQNVVRGVNVLRGSTRWGHHRVEVGWGRDGRPVTVLNYAVPENSFLTSGLVDHVRVTEDPHVLFGKYYLGDRFGGYFSLSRIS